jgi:hypothetical protein
MSFETYHKKVENATQQFPHFIETALPFGDMPFCNYSQEILQRQILACPFSSAFCAKSYRYNRIFIVKTEKTVDKLE